MKTSISIAMASPPSEPDELRTLVEIDRRRASIGVHVATDPTRPARTSSSLWLAPDAAAKLAADILAAVESWRADQAAVAWTVTTKDAGGRA